MNKNIINIVLIISLILTNYELNACICNKYSYFFFENIDDEQLIFKAKIIDHIKFEKNSLHTETITKILVEEWINNKTETDTLYYINGDEVDCYESITSFKEGQILIMKAYANSTYIDDFNFYLNFIPSILESKNYVNFINQNKNATFINFRCGESILLLKKSKVIGNISRNFTSKRLTRYILKKEKLNKLIEDYEKNGEYDKEQKIRRKLNRLKKEKQMMNLNKFKINLKSKEKYGL